MKNQKNTELNFLYLEDKKQNTKVAASKKSKTKGKKKHTGKESDNVFNFDDEIVIGVTPIYKKSEKEVKNRQKKDTSTSAKKKERKTAKGADNYAAPNPMKKKDKPSTKKKLKQRAKIQGARNNTIVKGILKWTILLLALMASFLFFMMSPLFNIQQIQVAGNVKLSEETIVSLSGIQIGQNLYQTSKHRIITSIKQNAYIEEVEVKRHLPNRIELMVTERKATFMIAYGASYLYINNQGYILEMSQQAMPNPILSGMKTPQEELQVGKRLQQDDLKQLEMVLKIMESAKAKGMGEKITHIDVSQAPNYSIRLEEERKTIYLGDISNLSSRMEYIKEILEDTKTLAGDIFIHPDMNEKEKGFFRPLE